MLCEKCKKRPACVHITKIVNGHKMETHVCEQCAHSLGELSFSFEDQFSVNDFLKGMFNVGPLEVPQEVACPSCGMTYSDFSRTGKIGCGKCYQTFAKELDSVIKRVHGVCNHTGKIPKRRGGKLAVHQQLQRLRKDLERCVAREEYEQAAKLRDQIKCLEQQAGGEKNVD